MKYADLHLHTTASDGTQTLKERVKQAKDLGLDCIAITDHDLLNPELKQPCEVRSGVELIAGAEMKAKLGDVSIEILGYFLDPEDTELKALLKAIREERIKRMQKMIHRINNLLKTDISLDEVRTICEESMGRPHLAKVMVDKSQVRSTQEAFHKYLDEGGPAAVPIQKPTHNQVIETIHQNGGLAVLSHPGTRKFENLDRALQKLKDSGLDGIEVFYPYHKKSRYFMFGVAKARKLADKFDFLITGGSDCHGEGSQKFAIGRVKLKYKYVDRLKENLG